MNNSLFPNEIHSIISKNGNSDIKQYESEDIESINWIDNWDFKNNRTDLYTHKIHSYPAMFIPQVIRKLLLRYSNENDRVVDIFCGSGTLLVEANLTNRVSFGIELNPLAILIAKVKTTPIKLELLPSYYEQLYENYFNKSFFFEIKNFKNIDFWYTGKAILNISKLITCINLIDDPSIKNFFLVSLSEILREVSLCKHSGFKMHRDIAKEKFKWDEEELFEKFTNVFLKNTKGLSSYIHSLPANGNRAQVIFGDATAVQNEIKANSIDLILTSPPYGDSRTTVAYGQFSRLSSQWLDLEPLNSTNIINLDADLLGGATSTIEINDPLFERSVTLNNAGNYFKSKIDLKANDKKESEKLIERFKDVISFYKDLDKALENGSYYLKKDKYFILITGSRTVKEIKLHTDLIIAELAEKYNMELKTIFYRNIINKRMPTKVSSTNIVGEKSATMTRESIIVLKKM